MSVSKEQGMRPAEIDLIDQFNDLEEKQSEDTEKLKSDIKSNADAIDNIPSYTFGDGLIVDTDEKENKVSVGLSEELKFEKVDNHTVIKPRLTTGLARRMDDETNRWAIGAKAPFYNIHRNGISATLVNMATSPTNLGMYSYAEGSSQCEQDFGHGEGINTICYEKIYHAAGKWNDKPPARTTLLRATGNGTEEIDRHNAETLDENGNYWVCGDIKCNKQDGNDAETYSLRNIGEKLDAAITQDKYPGYTILDDSDTIELTNDYGTLQLNLKNVPLATEDSIGGFKTVNAPYAANVPIASDGIYAVVAPGKYFDDALFANNPEAAFAFIKFASETNNGAITADLYKFISSLPAIEFGTSNSLTIPANSNLPGTIDFASAKTEAPLVFLSLQYARTSGGYLIPHVEAASNQQFAFRIENLTNTDIDNVTLDWVAISGR